MAQRLGRGITLLFHDRGTRMGWVVSSTLRPHFSHGKGPVPIVQEAGWAPGPVWTSGKSRPHRDSIPDRQARSQSLYRLSYPAHPRKAYCLFKKICHMHFFRVKFVISTTSHPISLKHTSVLYFCLHNVCPVVFFLHVSWPKLLSVCLPFRFVLCPVLLGLLHFMPNKTERLFCHIGLW